MRIGTRGSALALAQAGWVAQRLGPGSELVPITTAGDRDRAGGDKARWVSELERALLEDRIDVAVHSAKDVPAELAEGLELVAIPARAAAADAICGAPSLRALAPAAKVGTSSLRRSAQIRAFREDVEIVELRGNVDTRLRRLREGGLDAVVLAQAGLERLGRPEAIDGVLAELVPAAGQGALALEGRCSQGLLGRLSENHRIAGEIGHSSDVIRDRLVALRDPASTACVSAERELTAALGADCETPIGAHARDLGTGRLELEAWIGLPDGSEWLSDRISGEAGGLGVALARRLRSAGAEELLERAAAAA